MCFNIMFYYIADGFYLLIVKKWIAQMKGNVQKEK